MTDAVAGPRVIQPEGIDPRLLGPNGFKNWLYMSWKATGHPEPTALQYEIGDFIQNGGPKVAVCGFRGIAKSYIASAFVDYSGYVNRAVQALILSASAPRAYDFTTFTMQLLDALNTPEFDYLTDDLLPRADQRSSLQKFDFNGAPPAHAASVTSRGIFSQLTGQRASIILADDVCSLGNSQTATMREKIDLSLREFSAIGTKGYREVYLGTPQSEEDVLWELEDRGYVIRIWPVRVPTKRLQDLHGDRLSPLIQKMIADGMPPGTPTEPTRFDEEEIERRLQGYGPTLFAMQYDLDPSLSDEERYPVRLRDLIVTDLDPEHCKEKYIWANSPELQHGDELPCVGMSMDRYYRPMSTVGEMVKYTGICMAIDPSGRGDNETGYSVVAAYAGQLFLLANGGLQGGYEPPVLTELMGIAKRFNVSKIVLEENWGGGMFRSLLIPVMLASGHRCEIEEVRHSTAKEQRMSDVLEPVVANHRLVVDKSVIEDDYRTAQKYQPGKRKSYQLGFQLSRLTRHRGCLRYDDRVDALAMAVAFWTQAMALDVDKAAAKLKESKRDEQLRKFMESVIGPKPQRQGWIQ